MPVTGEAKKPLAAPITVDDGGTESVQDLEHTDRVDAELTVEGAYGLEGHLRCRRIHAELTKAGLRHVRKRFARRMRAAGICGRARSGGRPRQSQTRTSLGVLT